MNFKIWFLCILTILSNTSISIATETLLKSNQSIVFTINSDISIPVISQNQYRQHKELGLFPKNTVFILLDKKQDPMGPTWLRFGVEYSTASKHDLSDIWVLEDDFLKNNFLQVHDEALRMTYCYRYVKRYLLDHGLVDVYLPGSSAYMAADILPDHGFYRVSRGPQSAIVHDVCVYRGGPSGHGHIEVKTSSGWYYGYGYKQNPIKNRVLIACFHK